MARNLLGVSFLGILIKTALTFQAGTRDSIGISMVRLERDLRAVQSVAIVVLIVLFLWYAIPLARNLGGILIGYSLFVALSVLQLTVVAHFGSKAQYFWNHVQPMSYTVVVGIWISRLWTPDSATKRRSLSASDEGYEELAKATGRSLEEARGRLGSAVRS